MTAKGLLLAALAAHQPLGAVVQPCKNMDQPATCSGLCGTELALCCSATQNGHMLCTCVISKHVCCVSAACRALTKTGGGSGLTTNPATELSIPFTITATQKGPTSVGYVAGSVSVASYVSNPQTITGVTVTITGQQAQTIALSNCATTTLSAQGSTTCSFNVSNSAAPAAGSVTAAVALSGTSTTSSGMAFFVGSSGNTLQIHAHHCHDGILWVVERVHFPECQMASDLTACTMHLFGVVCQCHNQQSVLLLLLFRSSIF